MSRVDFFKAKLVTLYQQSTGRKLHRQVLRGALIGLLLVPILFTCFAGSAILFGYRFAGTFGTSMEPTLHDGDMIWVKHVNIGKFSIGDVVVLSSPELGSITHRIIDIEPVSKERYLVETKGDANFLSEYWLINTEDTVYVVVARIPLGGYMLDFISSLYGRVSIVCLGIAAIIAVRARRGKVKQM